MESTSIKCRLLGEATAFKSTIDPIYKRGKPKLWNLPVLARRYALTEYQVWQILHNEIWQE